LEGITYYSGETTPPDKAKAIHALDSFRLGRTSERADFWFGYAESASDSIFEERANEVVARLSQAQSFWSQSDDGNS